MRGKASGLEYEQNGFRITPAHAGKSQTFDFAFVETQDHPRACGEKTKKIPYHRLFPLRSAPFSFSFA